MKVQDCMQMRAYICVYRHSYPNPKSRNATEKAAMDNPDLRRFLKRYDDQNCYYDWGDDPSFFAAQEFLGDTRYASWGVCRPNVRKMLNRGDFIVFFCARSIRGGKWDYYYIGVGTVADGISHQTIWSDESYKPYRKFFNILLAPLAGSKLDHHEIFFPEHKDWRNRCAAPYLLFEPEQSRFNIINPLHVASGTNGSVEKWHSAHNKQVAQLEDILFPPSASPRRLRSTHPQRAHPQINLLNHLGPSTDFSKLRKKLLEHVAYS